MRGVLSVLSVPDEATPDEAIGTNGTIGTAGADAPLPIFEEPDLSGDYLDRVLDADWDDFHLSGWHPLRQSEICAARKS
jgi:hypothetical protein